MIKRRKAIVSRLATYTSCIASGPSDGVGVSQTDFLLYVSAGATERCAAADTVAYAAHCQQKLDLDRCEGDCKMVPIVPVADRSRVT